MHRMPLELRIFLCLSIGICLILSNMDSIWSYSVDMAHHYALIVRISEQWMLTTSTIDPTLGEMNFYPRFSHSIAALAGSLFDSPLVGLQLICLASNLALWAGFVTIIMSLPRYLSLPAAVIVVGAMCFNKLLPQAGLLFHAKEIIGGNFFFSQFVAQASGAVILALGLLVEQSKWAPAKRHAFIALLILPMSGVHLLPALEMLGVLVGLVVLSLLATKDRSGQFWKDFLISVLIVTVTIIGVTQSSGFKVMRELAQNNGGMALPHFSNIRQLCWLAGLVVVVSFALILVWWKSEARNKFDYLPIKYIGLYGLSAGLLCILQFASLRFGYGSEYAVKKYAFSIETILLLEVAVTAALACRKLSLKWIGTDRFADSSGGFLLILFVTGICYYCALPFNSERVLDTSNLVSVERQARLIRDTVLPNVPHKSDVVIDIADMPFTINYLLSIGIFRTPRDDLAASVLGAPHTLDLARVGSILASEGSRYDVPACRRLSLRSSLVLLDARCVADQRAR